MTYNMAFYALSSFIISVISIPVIIKLSHKHEVYDYSCSRKVHAGNIPRLGGLGVFFACFPLTLFYFLNNNTGFNHVLLLSGMVIAFLIGFIDDLQPIRARYKLVMQIAVACMVAGSGLLIKSLVVYSFFTINFGFMAYPITVLWIVAFMNAVNLIDGMDGLSTGIVLIANFFVIIISISSGNYHVLMLSLLLECSILGFYIFNFPPAKIFLGDGGAYFIGFMYAVFPLMGIKKSAALTAFLIPMILMLVPIFDVVQVMFDRFRNGHNLFHADNRHLHHRLMNLGFSTKGILAVVYFYTVVLGIFSLIMIISKPELTMILFSFILMILAISVFILKKAESVIAELKEKETENNLSVEKKKNNLIFFKTKAG